MPESKKMRIGKELTDEELMEMTGGGFSNCNKFRFIRKPHPEIIQPMYGIIPSPEDDITPVLKYGVQPLYGIKPIDLK